MRAVVWTAYGSPDVLRLDEVEKPTPKNNEVLIRVHASTVTAGDCEIRSLNLPLMLSLPMRAYIGILKPRRIKVLGQEFAGIIEAVGKDVTRFREGEHVFGISGFKSGGYAEHMCRPEHPKEMDGVLTIKPQSISFQEAAAIPLGGLESLHYLRKANIQPGQKVLIIGAGGSIGTIAVQLAKYYGAEVTAVDSKAKLGMLTTIGADHVIDYAVEDFSAGGEAYDVVLDVVGRGSFSRCERSLKKNGCYLLANPGLLSSLRGLWMTRGRKLISGNTNFTADDLIFLKERIEAGEIKVVIDRRYPIEQTAEAHRYVETGRKAGNVIISIINSK
jgi:NADPH:quinone reductase-like Zn-dependent oxidoreductase